jgi:hypothetical protein
MSQPLIIRLECESAGQISAIFEGSVKPRKRPRGVFDLVVRGIETPKGVPLELAVFYDASIDDGNLALTTSDRRVLWFSPLKRQSCAILMLPSDEELTISSR